MVESPRSPQAAAWHVFFERKLEAIDDEAMELYDEWTEADDRRLVVVVADHEAG